MEFILDNKKYSLLNHELFINYLMVDNYFRNHYSKYDYDIRFDFVEPLLEKEKIEFSKRKIQNNSVNNENIDYDWLNEE